jgi:hypothetical protein
MSDIVDNAFFIIETPPLLNRVNNSTSKTASQKEFLINRAIPFEHYSHSERERRISALCSVRAPAKNL